MPVIIVENGPQKGKRLSLEPPGPYVGGREASAAITVKDRMVSRRHFRIELRKDTYHLIDLESANGTVLNGSRTREHPLASGDRILVGETLLTFFPDREEDPLIGKTVSGFEVIERIGQGGMGTVYKARQKSLDRLVALKVLSRDLAEDRGFAEAFHREARAAGQINHPSIVQVYDVDTVQVAGQEITFFAMEYMPGGSVEDLLNRERQLPVEKTLEIALDTARGLEFAEKRGMVHRDIKPGNLMISDGGMVKIGDLGIARRAENGSKVSQKDGVSGSPHYISPEQAQGKDIDSGADIYSLGISLYHMLAGRPPFLGANARELVLKHIREVPPSLTGLRPDVPSPVVALISRMIEKERKRRHPSTTSLIAALERTLGEVRVAGERRSAVGQFLKRSLLVAGTVGALIGIGALAGIVIQGWQTGRQRSAEELARIEEALSRRVDDVQVALDAGNLDRAREEAEMLLEALRLEPDHQHELRVYLAEHGRLAGRIEEEEAAVRKRVREERAREELDRLLAEIPEDLPALGRVEDLERHQKPLEKFIGQYSDTAAVTGARQKADEIERAIRKLGSKLRRSRDAYLSIEGRVKTLLDFDPPAYRRALDTLRGYPREYDGTPSAEECRRRLESVERSMEESARRLSRELERAPEEKRSEVVRRLQRLRPEFEGQALEIIDRAIASGKD